MATKLQKLGPKIGGKKKGIMEAKLPKLKKKKKREKLICGNGIVENGRGGKKNCGNGVAKNWRGERERE